MPRANLLSIISELPPFLIRAMAVTHRKHERLSVDDLIAKSGIPRRTFLRISMMPSWEQVKLGTASKFIEACGVKVRGPLFNQAQLQTFAEQYAKANLPHLTEPQRKRFDKLAAKLKK